MAGKDTRHQVLEYLEQITENTDFQSAEKYSAASIAGRLNSGRHPGQGKYKAGIFFRQKGAGKESLWKHSGAGGYGVPGEL